MNGLDLVELIGNIGFPIAVAAWLLWQLPKATKWLQAMDGKLATIIILLERRP